MAASASSVASAERVPALASASAEDSPQPPHEDRRPSLVGRIRVALSTALAAILGLAPHILHHAGPLAGAALLAGTAGSLLFGAIGFIAAIPLLLRVRRRCGGWRVPAVLLATMAAAFSLSTFVVGPAITGDGGDDDAPVTAPDARPGHDGHH